ncbi:MAG: hypothetical protein AB9842_13985 [Bacteroidales bacterium]
MKFLPHLLLSSSPFTQSLFTLSLLTLSLFTLSLFTSCDKDSNQLTPVIQLITDSSYVYQDSMLQINQKIKVGIKAIGDARLTYFGIQLDADGQVFNLLDSGMFCNTFIYHRIISKGAANVERWTFTVMDENRNVTLKTLIFTRDPSSGFGQIKHHFSLILGAQDNTLHHHCLSMPSGVLFPADSASVHPELIDILFYYNPAGGTPPIESTFSSPGENDAPAMYPFLSSWPLLNSTYYNPGTAVTPDQFYQCENDSLLLAAYDESNGKRKYKNAAVGNIIPFKTQAGRKGLIYVKGLESGVTGWVEIEVKVQE